MLSAKSSVEIKWSRPRRDIITPAPLWSERDGSDSEIKFLAEKPVSDHVEYLFGPDGEMLQASNVEDGVVTELSTWTTGQHGQRLHLLFYGPAKSCQLIHIAEPRWSSGLLCGLQFWYDPARGGAEVAEAYAYDEQDRLGRIDRHTIRESSSSTVTYRARYDQSDLVSLASTQDGRDWQIVYRRRDGPAIRRARKTALTEMVAGAVRWLGRQKAPEASDRLAVTFDYDDPHLPPGLALGFKQGDGPSAFSVWDVFPAEFDTDVLCEASRCLMQEWSLREETSEPATLLEAVAAQLQSVASEQVSTTADFLAYVVDDELATLDRGLSSARRRRK